MKVGEKIDSDQQPVVETIEKESCDEEEEGLEGDLGRGKKERI